MLQEGSTVSPRTRTPVAEIRLEQLTKIYPDGTKAVDGLRQDLGPAHGRRARGDHRGPRLARRADGQQGSAEGPGHRDDLPELRALSAYVRLREHGVCSQDAEGAEARDRDEGRACGTGSGTERRAEEAPPHAVGRPAAA